MRIADNILEQTVRRTDDDWVSNSYNYISRQLHDQENHGIRRKRQKWFEDYVITRFENVKYNEELSSSQPIGYVPPRIHIESWFA